MQPSSLVLVAIVGMWAAYLVPSWIRRSEHHLARRRADRIAEDARVLEPRAAGDPEGPSTAPLLRREHPHVDARVDDVTVNAEGAAPAEDARAEGVRLAELLGDPTRALDDDAEVRAVEEGVLPPERSARILRRARAELPPDQGSPEVAPARRPLLESPTPEAPARPPRRREPRPAAPRPAAPRPVAEAPSAAARAARRRARILLGLLASCGVGWGAVTLGNAPAAAGAVPSGLLGADVVLLVATAPARARSRRAARVHARPAAGGGTHVSLDAVQHDEVEVAVAATARRRAGVVYDVRDAEPITEAETGREPTTAEVRQPDDGTWVPVPVPRPTYTMKPVVRRPEPLVIEPIEALPAADAGVRLGGSAPAAAAPQADDVDPAAHAEAEVAFDLDAVLARRRAVNG